MKIIIVLIILGASLSPAIEGQTTRKVLFIGNSYTYVNNLPAMIADIAHSAGDSLFADLSAPGGYTLKEHSGNRNTLDKIKSGHWDYVVLQEQSLLTAFPDDSVRTEVIPYARSLDSLIHVSNRRCETLFYMTWGRKNGDPSGCNWWPPLCTYTGMDSLVRQRYLMLAEINHASVAPVGAVWRFIRQTYPEINLYYEDGSHPSKAGSYAAACCFYTIMFRRSPFSVSNDCGIDASEARKIRTAVKKVVFDHLREWERPSRGNQQ